MLQYVTQGHEYREPEKGVGRSKLQGASGRQRKQALLYTHTTSRKCVCMCGNAPIYLLILFSFLWNMFFSGHAKRLRIRRQILAPAPECGNVSQKRADARNKKEFDLERLKKGQY